MEMDSLDTMLANLAKGQLEERIRVYRRRASSARGSGKGDCADQCEKVAKRYEAELATRSGDFLVERC